MLTLQLDKYRAAAKRHAWYDDEEDPNAPPNYNPFRKINPRIKRPSDAENPPQRAPTNLSENYATSHIEEKRLAKSMEGVHIPKHADTMPSSSVPGPPSKSLVEAPVSDTQDMAATQHLAVDPEKKKDSSEGSGTTSGETAVESEIHPNGKPRRRTFPFLGRKGKENGSAEEEKPRRQSSLFRKDPQKFTAVGQLRATILNSWINVLLIFVPIGIAVNFANIPKVAVFVINFIAIIPLAAMLSYATEEIALRVGETLGGLLNATFGYTLIHHTVAHRPLIRC